MKPPDYSAPLGVEMMVDPFTSPPASMRFADASTETELERGAVLRVSLPTKPPSLIAAYAKHVGLAEKIGDRTVLHSTRADRPRRVLDAKPFGKCIGCDEATWISPSSLRALHNPEVVVVCDDCIPVESFAHLLFPEGRR